MSEQPLAALLSALAASGDDGAGRAIVDGYLGRFQCIAILVHRHQNEGLDIATHYGLSPSAVRHVAHVPEGMRLPITSVLATGSDAWLSPREVAAFPLAAPLVRSLASNVTWSVNVVRRGGVSIGTAVVVFAGEPRRGWELRARLEALLDALGLWLSGPVLAEPPATTAPAGAALTASAGHDVVSERQREILALVSEGQTNPQIAERLSVSVATVKGELSVLFALLGASRRADLPPRAIRAGV